MALTARGQCKEARPHLEAAVAVDGAPPEHARELARVYLEVNKPNKAEPLIEQALLALPADPELHMLRAEAQQAPGKPWAAGSFVYAGELLLNAGRARDALTALEQAEALRAGEAPVFAQRRYGCSGVTTTHLRRSKRRWPRMRSPVPG